jgi:Holliday junction resolvase
MSGRSAKAKGSNAEREIVEILNAAGYDVHRTPHSGALEWLKGDVTGFPGCHIEVKRCESLRIPEWCRKAEAEAEGKTALLIFRRSWEPWRVCVRLDEFLRMMEAGQEDGAVKL